MSAEKTTKKIGAVIYLRTVKPLRLEEFIAEFRKLWPGLGLVGTRREQNSAFFQVGDFEIAIEMRRTPVPQAVTDAILAETAHWVDARQQLATHQAHLAVAGSVEAGKELSFASNLTKTIVALLAITESVGVCWLNAPVLHSALDFAGIAQEMFGAGVPPLILWIAALWKPELKSVHTKGMVQFGGSKIMLTQQLKASAEVTEYLFEVAYYVLSSSNQILEGETVDGPNGTFKVSAIEGADPSKRMLIFVPMKIN